MSRVAAEPEGDGKIPVCRATRARKRFTAGARRALVSLPTPKVASIGSSPAARSTLAGMGISAGGAAWTTTVAQKRADKNTVRRIHYSVEDVADNLADTPRSNCLEPFGCAH